MKEQLARAWNENLRLATLRLLAEAPGYSLNDRLVTDALPTLGIAATRDQVRTGLSWLAEQDLVRREELGGGLVVATFGWKLLQSGVDADNKSATAAAREATQVDAFYPLTMPLTVGPGGISVAIALGSQRPAAGSDVTHLLLLAGAAIVGIVAVAVTVFVCYRFAERMIAMLGRNGTNVLVRLSAFVLLCIGIQIIWTGVKTLIAAG